MLMAIVVTTLLLAAVNGANDNIKGAATLFGSGIVGYRAAIALATAATTIGGALSIVVANGLLVAFSGKGIVPPAIAGSVPFLLSAGLGAAVTVGAATRFGLPISTTHVSAGALFGIAATNRSGGKSVIRNIVLAWLLTLPAAALCAYISYVPFT